MPQEHRFEGWGEIAKYLHREIRTVQRWEHTLGLPIHRLDVGKQGSVYAYPSELDKWLLDREKRNQLDEGNDSPSAGTDTPITPIRAETDTSNDAGKKTEEVEDPPLPKPPPPRPPVSFGKWLLGFTAVVVAGGVGYLIVAGLTPKVTVDPHDPLSGAAKIRLFVRPLVNNSGDAKQDLFSDGLTSEIITQIGRENPGHLGVIGITTSKQLKDKSVADLRNLLHVQFVLEGSVRADSNQIRVDVQLISASDETTILTDSYADDFTDILKVQDRVSTAVAEKILRKFPTTENAAPPSEINPEGYRDYLHGRRYWTMRDVAASVKSYKDAVALLPSYAPAHAGLASAYALMGQAPNDGMPPALSAPRARAEAEQALALDPNNAEAHYVLGNLAMHFDWDYARAEQELSEAIRLDPNNPTAHQWMGQYLLVRGRFSDAKIEVERALELDKFSPIFTTARAEAEYYARDFDGTISDSQLTLEEFPNFVLAEFWLGSAYREKKMYLEAIDHFSRAVSLVPDNPALLMAYGHVLAISGDKNHALHVLSQLQTLSAHRYVPAIYFAGIYTGLGQKDDAFHALQTAVGEKNDRLVYIAVEPLADSLRSDPRFQDLVHKIHLQ